jgi:hypothetical protein
VKAVAHADGIDRFFQSILFFSIVAIVSLGLCMNGMVYKAMLTILYGGMIENEF